MRVRTHTEEEGNRVLPLRHTQVHDSTSSHVHTLMYSFPVQSNYKKLGGRGRKVYTHSIPCMLNIPATVTTRKAPVIHSRGCPLMKQHWSALVIKNKSVGSTLSSLSAPLMSAVLSLLFLSPFFLHRLPQQQLTQPQRRKCNFCTHRICHYIEIAALIRHSLYLYK